MDCPKNILDNSQSQKREWVITPGLMQVINEFVDLYETMYGDNAMNNRKPLMICGDTGVGKSLFVKLFEKLEGKEIKRLNCASYESNLILAELFGYVKGAFTGATSNKQGLLEVNNDEPICLEEIGELSMPDQAKLLTFLETGCFYPVGGTEEKTSNALIISTTNKPIENFRPDFWNRFFQFYVPAIHERRIDVFYYFAHFFPDLIKTLNKQDVLSFLAYHWPGNVREIENTGSLMKWKDRFRANLLNDNIIHVGATVSGILYKENKYSALNCNVSHRLMRFQEYGMSVDMFAEFFKRINLCIVFTDLLFRNVPPLKYCEYSSKLGLPLLLPIDQFEKLHASLHELCRVFLHMKRNSVGWVPNTEINQDLLEITMGDAKNFPDDILVWAGGNNQSELYMQSRIYELRTGRNIPPLHEDKWSTPTHFTNFTEVQLLERYYTELAKETNHNQAEIARRAGLSRSAGQRAYAKYCRFDNGLDGPQ